MTLIKRMARLAPVIYFALRDFGIPLWKTHQAMPKWMKRWR